MSKLLLILISACALAASAKPSESEIRKLVFPVSEAKPENFKKYGPEVMPVLADIYKTSTDDEKATIAWLMYSLGTKSPEAKAVLLKDVHTQHSKLRLQVQWALGRVSSDDEVVEILLENMQNDGNPLFRDKAACALASDQIHLNEKQKFKLYQGLIKALNDPKPQVRDIALKALQIQTGQTKNFLPNGNESQRAESIKEWNQWLQRYQAQI